LGRYFYFCCWQAKPVSRRGCSVPILIVEGIQEITPGMHMLEEKVVFAGFQDDVAAEGAEPFRIVGVTFYKRLDGEEEEDIFLRVWGVARAVLVRGPEEAPVGLDGFGVGVIGDGGVPDGFGAALESGIQRSYDDWLGIVMMGRRLLVGGVVSFTGGPAYMKYGLGTSAHLRGVGSENEAVRRRKNHFRISPLTPRYRLYEAIVTPFYHAVRN
jgi:hypothetical protein